MKNYIVFTILLFVTLLCLSMSVEAQTAEATPTPFKASTNPKKLAKQLKSAFSNLGEDVHDLGQSFADTLASKSSWSGNVIAGTSTGVTLNPITITFTPDADDNASGSWSSNPISLASIASGGTYSGNYVIFGNAMYLFNIQGEATSSATLFISLPKPGKPVLSFHISNITPAVIITVE